MKTGQQIWAPGSPAAKAGLQMGDRILAVNEISIKNFNRDKIVAILSGSGKNPTVTILDCGKPKEENERLSRMDATRFSRICERFSHHASVDGLFEELKLRFPKFMFFYFYHQNMPLRSWQSSFSLAKIQSKKSKQIGKQVVRTRTTILEN